MLDRPSLPAPPFLSPERQARPYRKAHVVRELLDPGPLKEQVFRQREKQKALHGRESDRWSLWGSERNRLARKSKTHSRSQIFRCPYARNGLHLHPRCAQNRASSPVARKDGE